MWTKFEPKDKESWPEPDSLVEYEVTQNRHVGFINIDVEGDVAFGNFYSEESGCDNPLNGIVLK